MVGTWGRFMLFRRTGRLEWPDTLSTNIPVAWKTPSRSASCPAGGCTCKLSRFTSVAALTGEPGCHHPSVPLGPLLAMSTEICSHIQPKSGQMCLSPAGEICTRMHFVNHGRGGGGVVSAKH